MNYRIVAVGIGDDDYKDAKFLLTPPDPPLHLPVHKYIVENMSEVVSFIAQAKVTNKSTRNDTDYIGHIKKITLTHESASSLKQYLTASVNGAKRGGLTASSEKINFSGITKYTGYYAAMTALELVLDDPSLIRKGEKYP